MKFYLPEKAELVQFFVKAPCETETYRIHLNKGGRRRVARGRGRGSVDIAALDQHQLGQLGFACLIVLVACIINQKGVANFLAGPDSPPCLSPSPLHFSRPLSNSLETVKGNRIN